MFRHAGASPSSCFCSWGRCSPFHFAFPTTPPADGPITWELAALAVGVGAPFIGLASFSPTVQGWLAGSRHPRASDPFFLYAASNVGSFLGLLAYPLLIEPNIGLESQGRYFRWAYLALIGLALGVVLVARPVQNTHLAALRQPIHPSQKLRWIVLAAVPALMLLAVTRHLATDVASFPLLWVVPLALYLGTFIVAFSSRSARFTSFSARAFPMLVIVAVTASVGVINDLRIGLVVPLLILICAGLIGHGRLFATRPDVSRLTEYYLWVSVGGAIGGMLGAFAAPMIFNSIAEYPIALVATAALLPGVIEKPSRRNRVVLVVWAGLLAASLLSTSINLTGLLVGLAGLTAYLVAGRSPLFAFLLAGCLLVANASDDGEILARERTFYGVYKVLENDEGFHLMVSGTTVHGVQQFEPEISLSPVAYYIPEGPIGQLMTTIGRGAEHIAVLGLGAGVQSAFLEPGQRLTYYEIDPVVGDLATNPDLFTFTAESAGEIDFVFGDGRLALEPVEAQFDLLFMDAFTSDAIPTHLLTVEAVELYFTTLKENGVLGFHISNRHLDLEPVVGRIVEHLGLEARIIDFVTSNPRGSASTFVVIARDLADVAELVAQPGWRPLRIGDDLWTDDFTNLLGVIR